MTAEPIFGPATWPAPPAGKRRWQLSRWATVVVIVLAASVVMLAGTLLVKARADEYHDAQRACRDTARMLVQQKPMLKYTVLSGDACRDVKRLRGEDA